MAAETVNENDDQKGGVIIGDVDGGIENSTIAGRDVIKNITNYFIGDSNKQRDIRNRHNMLQLVQKTWIEGVLNQSLHGQALLELGMETKPGALINPWDKEVQMPDRESEPVKPGTSMLKLFDQANGSLLILGEPGSGKTTVLLELCRLLIEQAEEELAKQIPIVLNLSTWKPNAKKKPTQAFTEWLVSELKDKYFVSNKISRPWIEEDALVLLLDGMDEISAENRDTCVLVINEFLTEHSIPVAVCSRRQEYEGLSTRLALRDALLIQSLTIQQVDAYLRAAGEGLAMIDQALKRDPGLQEFAQSPLILTTLLLAYQDASEEDLAALEKAGNYQKRLFDIYIDRMFKRRSISQSYSPAKTQAWLSWLAQMMIERKQSIFSIEAIQPSWLPFSPFVKLLILWLLYGLLFGIIFLGLMVSVYSSQVFLISQAPSFADMLMVSTICGPMIGLIPALIVGFKDKQPTDRLNWSWKGIPKGLVKGLLIGLLIGMLGLFNLLFYNLEDGLDIVLNTFLYDGLIGALMGGFIGGLNRLTVDLRSRPGAGITTSLKNYLIAVLVIGTTVALVNGVRIQLDLMLSLYGYSPYSIGNLIIGLIFGLIGGLAFGGDFLIKHFTTRMFLILCGRIPGHLIDFLEYAKERVFLRRVGGGYIFINRMLMEHFAKMNHGTAR